MRYNELSYLLTGAMHLKQLKLAGFKSFVDPVVIPFSSQLVAVVGPNGCGKSNIIDAVRWVMGESSAKSLRGESMVDVIFNGSSNRKSVGQASVELVFDNQLGKLGGSFASFQEIAVKRVVTRDGESSYYLNGTRCRRKDITDIFLGTGAGARGYSIISQGTISRLIEARPEELRAYIEEAAGVSKYKERRRETLQRIASTRENLARVKDISDELAKQLVRLARQAESAKQYTLLKQEEQQCRADIHALKWQALVQEQEKLRHELSQLSVQIEYHHAQITTALKEATHTKNEITDAHEALETIKAAFHQLNTEIARLEEKRQQSLRDQERLLKEKQTLQVDWEKITHLLSEEKNKLVENEKREEQLKAIVQELQFQFEKEQQSYQLYREEEAIWNQAWQAMQNNLLQSSKEAESAQLRIQNLQDKRQHLQQTMEKNQAQILLNPLSEFYEILTELKMVQETLDIAYHNDSEKAQEALAHAGILRQELLEKEQQLHQAENELRTLSTQHAALEALQNSALNRQFAKTHHLVKWQNTPRVAELIDAPLEWQEIIEWVLGERLYAIVLESMDDLLPDLKHLRTSFAMFVTPSMHKCEKHSYPKLVDHIQGSIPNGMNALKDIFAANDLDEALSWLPTLAFYESIVTLDGYWLGPGWVHVSNQKSTKKSLLAQKKELMVLNEALSKQQLMVTLLQNERTIAHQRLTEHIEYQENCKEIVMRSLDAKRANESKLQHQLQEVTQKEAYTQRLQEEQETLGEALAKIEQDLTQAEEQWQIALHNKVLAEQKQSELMQNKNHHQEALSLHEARLNETRQTLHDKEVSLTKITLHIHQLKNNIDRETDRLEQLQERLDVVSQSLVDLMHPDSDMSNILDVKMNEHQKIEGLRIDAQKHVDALNEKYLIEEQKIQHNTQDANRIQEKIQSLKVQEETLNVRMASIKEALIELALTPEDVLSKPTTHLSLQVREEFLFHVLEKIKRLGAINLVAIEEYQEELARKAHLDQQSEDLVEALSALDSAILKMDRETQARFKETFDEVNALFQTLFPRLFGGGRAMLELNCGNLLEAGVLVMAQPPGKRNSTIQLLSGGEKAMTAVALVFAIFKLNPSPFCMLDEVDAPLDDANVRRFCDLMKEMSECVQFLFITHNKVTMELAHHLIGVTMREPGVSRVVAVDVEEALSITQ